MNVRYKSNKEITEDDLRLFLVVENAAPVGMADKT